MSEQNLKRAGCDTSDDIREIEKHLEEAEKFLKSMKGGDQTRADLVELIAVIKLLTRAMALFSVMEEEMANQKECAKSRFVVGKELGKPAAGPWRPIEEFDKECEDEVLLLDNNGWLYIAKWNPAPFKGGGYWNCSDGEMVMSDEAVAWAPIYRPRIEKETVRDKTEEGSQDDGNDQSSGD